MLIVVIDPGHTKDYNGGVAPGYYEGNMAFALAQFLKEELEKGTDQVKVIFTKDTLEERPGVYDRGQVAVEENAVLILSLHSNAISDATKYEKAYGISIYRSLYLPDSEDLGNKLADAIVAVMAPYTGVTYSRGVLTREGSKGDYYGLIRGAVNGARSIEEAEKGSVKHVFLIEHGFHTNSKECAFLNDDTNLRKLAKAEANVIKAHFGIVTEKEEYYSNASEGETKEKSIVNGTIKVIYEGADGLSIHATPEWGGNNIDNANGPVFAGDVLVATEKVKVGNGFMYKVYKEAGYVSASEKYVTFTPSQDAAANAEVKEIKAGDIVKVIKNEKYAGGTFKLYYDKYTVLSVSGDRAVIGIGKTVTAAINVKNIVAV